MLHLLVGTIDEEFPVDVLSPLVWSQLVHDKLLSLSLSEAYPWYLTDGDPSLSLLLGPPPIETSSGNNPPDRKSVV